MSMFDNVSMWMLWIIISYCNFVVVVKIVICVCKIPKYFFFVQLCGLCSFFFCFHFPMIKMYICYVYTTMAKNKRIHKIQANNKKPKKKNKKIFKSVRVCVHVCVCSTLLLWSMVQYWNIDDWNANQSFVCTFN